MEALEIYKSAGAMKGAGWAHQIFRPRSFLILITARIPVKYAVCFGSGRRPVWGTEGAGGHNRSVVPMSGGWKVLSLWTNGFGIWSAMPRAS